MQFLWDFFGWMPIIVKPFDLIEWLWVLLFMLVGITFAIFTRKEEITLPQRIGNKIRPGTLGQYIITFALSFFFQAYGIIPVAAGLYAGTAGTAANQLQKAFGSKLSQAEMEEKLKAVIEDFEQYKKYTEVVKDERERRVLEKIFKILKTTPEEIGSAALKVLGFGDVDKEVIELGADVIEEITDYAKTQLSLPLEKDPVARIEMTIKEAREILKRTRKKKRSLFRR